MRTKFPSILFITISLLAIALAAFINLDRLPIRLWDESRLANSAYEMYRNGWSLVTTYDGSPDMWNTKPPLLIWMQTLAMHLFGPNELAVRLPSGIAVFLTCAGMFYFSRKATGRYLLGFFSAFVLISCVGFNEFHTGRSGDYDALLTMWTTFAAFAFFLADRSRFQSRRWSILFFVFLAFAVLTKSVAGLLFAPAFLIYVLVRGNFMAAIKSRHVWWGVAIFVVSVLGFYLIREALGPGYLKAVMENDVFGRYNTALEGHRGSPKYYLMNLINFRFAEFYLFAVAGIIVLLFMKKSPVRDVGLYAVLMFVIYMLVISFGQTKLEWYDNPIFPFAALMAGVFFVLLSETLSEALGKTALSNHSGMVVSALVFLFFLYPPYIAMVGKNYKREQYPWDVGFYARANFLQKAVKGEYDLNGVAVVQVKYAAHEYFYVRKLQDAGVEVGRKDISEVEVGDTLLLGSWSERDSVYRRATDLEVLWKDPDDLVEIVRIQSLKP